MPLLIPVLAVLLLRVVQVLLSSPRDLHLPTFRHLWLAPVGVVPQLLVVHFHSVAKEIPDSIARWALAASFLILFAFTAYNWKIRPVRILGIGLLLNFLVMSLNGGFMPIRPDVVTYLYPNAPSWHWHVNGRLGVTKDIVLLIEDTKLFWLSDYFTLPKWMSIRVAFSVGDVLIVIGALGLLWAEGNAHNNISSNWDRSWLKTLNSTN